MHIGHTLTLKVLVATNDAQWVEMGDVGSARYEPALLPPCPTINVNVNVNVSVYSLKSPLSSADFTIYAPGIGTLSYTVSSPLGRIQHLRTLLQL